MISAKHQYKVIGSDDFVRRFSLRSDNLMWFLGAGASASSGLPTAADMVWDFKQKLFVSQRRVSYQTVSDLSDQTVRNRIQSHIDSLERLPSSGDPEEYAALFEEVYPSEQDRRAYLDAKLAGAKPSYGHLALATLMRAERSFLLWTTNFDSLVADACARVYETTGRLTTVDLDTTTMGTQIINERRWPIEVKLHGDFRSRRLKNTTDEIREQDSFLRQSLVDSCRNYGLIVVGYSARDNSIMDTFEESTRSRGAYPAGLFWLYRSDDQLLPRVTHLLNRATNAGLDAALVEIESFDEILRDVVRYIDDLDTKTLDEFSMAGRVRSPAESKRKYSRGWPVVRLNAVPVVEIPNICRRVACEIGGTREVRQAVKDAGVKVLAVRSKYGVLSFGSDSDIKNAFRSYNIADFDFHNFEKGKQKYDSTERGLLREALTLALARSRKLMIVSRGRGMHRLVPADFREATWKSLRALVGEINGSVSGHPELRWHEGIGISLDWADDRLWLLIEPCTVFEGLTDVNKVVAAQFARERVVKRYNRLLNDLISVWVEHLSAAGGELRALNITSGIDAVFRLSSVTAFSRFSRREMP